MTHSAPHLVYRVLTPDIQRGTIRDDSGAEGRVVMPDKGPGSKGGAKKPKGGKAAAKAGKK